MEKKTILVVDDDYSARDLIVQVLQDAFPEYNIISAENGSQATKLLEENNISVCVTDGRMPMMDGFSLISHIKQLYPHIGIIFVTACHEQYNKADAFCFGADVYIKKPFDIEDLTSAVQKSINKNKT